MKIGAEPGRDIDRVRAAREATGSFTNLFVDANGAFNARQAIAFSRKIEQFNITWFEEPVSSDDLDGLRWVRDRVPDAIEVAAGEYGFGRTHDVSNLFVCDGSILPTQGSANPGLTIQALAARTADYLIKQGDAIFFSNRRDLSEPAIRYDLSPPYTRLKGNPRIA